MDKLMPLLFLYLVVICVDGKRRPVEHSESTLIDSTGAAKTGETVSASTLISSPLKKRKKRSKSKPDRGKIMRDKKGPYRFDFPQSMNDWRAALKEINLLRKKLGGLVALSWDQSIADGIDGDQFQQLRSYHTIIKQPSRGARAITTEPF